ncbi:hypothetical protein GCM10027184_38560 [Saccharothrix stipae]
MLSGSPEWRLSSDSVTAGRSTVNTDSNENARSSSDFGVGTVSSLPTSPGPSTGAVFHPSETPLPGRPGAVAVTAVGVASGRAPARGRRVWGWLVRRAVPVTV